MSSWINLSALWKILVWSLALGAGLPALFAFGLLALDYDATHGEVVNGSATASRRPIRVAAAGLCFAIVVAAVAYGIYFLVQG